MWLYVMRREQNDLEDDNGLLDFLYVEQSASNLSDKSEACQDLL